MAQVAEAAQIDVTVAPEVDKPVTFSLSNHSLETLLDKIAREQGLNVIVGWKQLGESPAEIASVKILPTSLSNSGAQPLPSTQDWERQARRQFNKDKSREEREKRKLERAAKRNQQ